jgi:hypothetical protein
MESVARSSRTAEQEPEHRGPDAPPFRSQPNSIEETGIGFGQLTDLCVKTIYQVGRITARDISDRLCLPFAGVVEPVLAFLKREKFVEVVGAGGLSEQQYQYSLSDRGNEKAVEALSRNQYVGPAPAIRPLRGRDASSRSTERRRELGDEAVGELRFPTAQPGGPAVSPPHLLLRRSGNQELDRRRSAHAAGPVQYRSQSTSGDPCSTRVHQPIETTTNERRPGCRSTQSAARTSANIAGGR